MRNYGEFPVTYTVNAVYILEIICVYAVDFMFVLCVRGGLRSFGKRNVSYLESKVPRI